MSTTGFHVRGHLGTASWLIHIGLFLYQDHGPREGHPHPSPSHAICYWLQASMYLYHCVVDSVQCPHHHPPVDQSGICVPCSHWYSCLNQSLNSSRHAHPSHQQGGPAAGGAMAGAC